MLNKKGLTLLEVLLAMAILGILAIGPISAMVTHYSMLTKTREITVDAFETQQDMEKRIEEVKKQLTSNNGSEPSGEDLEKKKYVLFEENGSSYMRNVTGYNIVKSINNPSRKLFTIVTNWNIQYDVAEANNAEIWFYYKNTKQSNAYTWTDNLQVRSNFNLHDPKGVNLTNLHNWYVSRKGFNIAMTEDTEAEELDLGIKYPRFPEDYELIAGATSNILFNIKDEYRGRHIIYTVTPAAKSGKMGKTVHSYPLLISGLPKVSNSLKVHLDASMIVSDDDITKSGNDKFVKRWADLSGSGHHAVLDNNGNAKQPQLIDAKFGEVLAPDGQVYDTYARFVRFSGNQSLLIKNNNSLNMNSFTLFAVIRSEGSGGERSIISRYKWNGSNSNQGGWRLGWNSSGNLEFSIRGSSSQGTITQSIRAGSKEGLNGDWHIIRADLRTQNNDFTLRVDEGSTYTERRTIQNLNGNNEPIYIGIGNGTYTIVDIAEIIIYDGTLSQNDSEKVYSYLKEKYNPEEPDIKIYSIDPVNEKILLGEDFTMPSTVVANMTSGTSINLPVTWSPAALDISTPGIKTSVGTVIYRGVEYTTTLTLRVLSIEYLLDKTDIVTIGDIYKMPKTVTAVLSDGSKREVSVTWSPPSIDTTTLGIKTSTGIAVLDPDKTMTLTVEVLPGIQLSQKEILLNIGQKYDLTAILKPEDYMEYQSVEWRTDNPEVATVEGNGLTGVITAVDSGTTTVSVILTSSDGSAYTDTCTVTVSQPVLGILLNKTNMNLYVRDSETLIATVFPDNAVNKNIIWSSSDPSVATVDADGKVTAVKKGTAVITVTTEDGGKTAQCTVNVDYKPLQLETYSTDSGRRWLSLTFNKNISRADINSDVTNVKITSNEVMFTRQQGVNEFLTGTLYVVDVTDLDGLNKRLCFTFSQSGVQYQQHKYVESFNGNGRSLTINFSENIQSASIDSSVTNVNVNRKTVTFTRQSNTNDFLVYNNNYDNAYQIRITFTNGETAFLLMGYLGSSNWILLN